MRANREAELRLTATAVFFPGVALYLPVRPEYFDDGRCGVIWAAIRALAEERRAVLLAEQPDMNRVMIGDQLRSMAGEKDWHGAMKAFLDHDGHYSAIDGDQFMLELTARVVTESDAERLSQLVITAWQARALHRLNLEANERYMTDPVDEVLDWQQGRQSQIMLAGRQPAQPIAVHAERFVEALRERRERDPASERMHGAVRTGLLQDDYFAAAPRGKATILGALPGHGKTQSGIDWAEHLELEPDDGVVLLFHCEENTEHYAISALARETLMDSKVIREGYKLTERDVFELAQAAKKIGERRSWYPVPAHTMTGADIRRYVMRHNTREKVGAVVVDYIQALREPRGTRSKAEGVERNMRELVALVGGDQGLNIPLLVLAQIKEDLRHDLARAFEGDYVTFMGQNIAQDSSQVHKQGKVVWAQAHPAQLVPDGDFDPRLLVRFLVKNTGGRVGATCWYYWERATGHLRDDLIRRCSDDECSKIWIQEDPRPGQESCPVCHSPPGESLAGASQNHARGLGRKKKRR